MWITVTNKVVKRLNEDTAMKSDPVEGRFSSFEELDEFFRGKEGLAWHYHINTAGPVDLDCSGDDYLEAKKQS